MPKPYRQLQAMFPRNRWRITEGDQVVVRGTPFSGQIGRVLAVLRDVRAPQVVVEGVNLRKKQIPLGQTEEDNMVVTMEHPIHYSNVNLVEPVSTSELGEKKGSWPGVRAKFRYDQNGNRVRIGKGRNALGRIIPWPAPVEEKPVAGGVKDTEASAAAARTHAHGDFQSFLASTGSRFSSSSSSSSSSSDSNSASSASSPRTYSSMSSSTSSSSPQSPSSSTPTTSRGVGPTGQGPAHYSTATAHSVMGSWGTGCGGFGGIAGVGMQLDSPSTLIRGCPTQLSLASSINRQCSSTRALVQQLQQRQQHSYSSPLPSCHGSFAASGALLQQLQ